MFVVLSVCCIWCIFSCFVWNCLLVLVCNLVSSLVFGVLLSWMLSISSVVCPVCLFLLPLLSVFLSAYCTIHFNSEPFVLLFIRYVKVYRYHTHLEKTSIFGDSPGAENLRLVVDSSIQDEEQWRATQATALVFLQQAKWKIITGVLSYLRNKNNWCICIIYITMC